MHLNVLVELSHVVCVFLVCYYVTFGRAIKSNGFLLIPCDSNSVSWEIGWFNCWRSVIRMRCMQIYFVLCLVYSEI